MQKTTTTDEEYAKPYGLQKMIEAWEADQEAESGIMADPHMNMAAVLRRMDRTDAKRLPALFGRAGGDHVAWSAYNSLFIPNRREEVTS